MNEEQQAKTPAFFTLDAFNGDLVPSLVLAMEAAQQGDQATWGAFIDDQPNLRARLTQQGLTDPRTFSTIHWDRATLLFTACLEVDNEGRPLQIGERLTRERFGRFPDHDGSALAYFVEHIRPNRSITDNDGSSMYDRIVELMEQLNDGLTEAHHGHDGYESGFGGLQMLGHLSASEVGELRRLLAGRSWTVSYEEPFDGGVADIAKHFTTLLKAAERRNVGLVHRRHR